MPLPRRLLLAQAAASAAALAAAPARAGGMGARWIWTRNQAGEEIALAYRTPEGLDTNAIARLQHHFRDIRENLPGPLPTLLIDLLSMIQEGFGHERPISVVSGYRTPRTNASLEGAAPASLHLAGMAADISMRGVEPLDLALAAASLARRLGIMGIGLYPRFVHVDIGPRRVWTRLGPAA